jgi:transcriptional regulator with GAF, ATPase, and Fis domain
LRAEESDQPADRLLALLSISEKLNSERDVSSLLTLIAREAARLLDAELASLFLLDATRRELWSRVTLDTDETLRFDAGQGIAGEALRSGQIIRVDNVRDDARFFPGVDASTGHQTRNLLAVPLRNLRGEAIGVFEVLNKHTGAFSDDSPPASGLPGVLKDAVEQLERRMIVAALEKCHHNQQQAARSLGLSRQGLIKKTKRFGIATRAPTS